MSLVTSHIESLLKQLAEAEQALKLEDELQVAEQELKAASEKVSRIRQAIIAVLSALSPKPKQDLKLKTPRKARVPAQSTYVRKAKLRAGKFLVPYGKTREWVVQVCDAALKDAVLHTSGRGRKPVFHVNGTPISLHQTITKFNLNHNMLYQYAEYCAIVGRNGVTAEHRPKMAVQAA